MLAQMRKQAAGLMAKILLGMLVLSFAIWGIGDIFRHAGDRPLATIDDVKISRQEFNRILERETEGLRRSMGKNYSPRLLQQMGIADQVLQNLINTILIKKEADDLGIRISDSAVAARIRNTPIFQNEKKQFDKNAFARALSVTGLNEATYVHQLKQEMASDLLTSGISGADFITPLFIASVYTAQEEQRVADLLTLPAGAARNIADPTDEALAAFYETHDGQFKTPAVRTLSFVVINGAELAKNSHITDDEIEQAYKNNLDNYSTPERRKLDRLMYDSKDAADKAYSLLKAGRPLAAVAKDTQATNAGNLSMGLVKKSEIPNGSEDAIFALKKGEFSTPVETPFGWQIFYVTAIEPPYVPKLSEMRATIIKDLTSRGQEDGVYKITAALEDELAAGGTLEEAAAKVKLGINTVGPITADGKGEDGKTPYNLPRYENFLTTAFGIDEKEESPLTQAADGSYFIVRADSALPERTRPLQDIKTQVIALWKDAQKAARLETLAGEVAEKLRTGVKPETIAAEYHLQRSSTGKLRFAMEKDSALPAPLIREIFSLGLHQSSGAYRLKNGDYALAVVREITAPALPSATQAEKKDSALGKLRESLIATHQNEMLEQYLRYLRGKYNVVIDTKQLADDSE